ncbi:hypothetical protein AT2G05655 [Arabidopsis thaliana]|jgi:hypothetical protein|nr:uncharacterized protein AT2G05655 [Arabidopsis thaliana]ANM62716.1 hypothetical protein AT2G05655 [Arabidopsis thaliana]|eukprot:NP_001324855.1 hypothetical protein AT2G05655 [Arabidopsis thaliana]
MLRETSTEECWYEQLILRTEKYLQQRIRISLLGSVLITVQVGFDDARNPYFFLFEFLL